MTLIYLFYSKIQEFFFKNLQFLQLFIFNVLESKLVKDKETPNEKIFECCLLEIRLALLKKYINFSLLLIFIILGN